MAATVEQLLWVCHACDRRNESVCGVDGESVLAHARASACPLGKYADGTLAKIVCQRKEAEEQRRNAPPPQPLPYASWSLAARWVAKCRIDGEPGVGTTLKRLFGAGGRTVEWGAKRLGVDCGCAARKARLDLTHPYSELPQ